MRSWLALFLFYALPLAHAQRLPDIGEQMRASRDYDNIFPCPGGNEKGPLCYDVARVQFVCCSSLNGGMHPLLIDLVAGTVTHVCATATTGCDVVTVGALGINEFSLVHCDCHATSALECNNGGRWLSGVRAANVATDAFDVRYDGALGNEEVVCVWQ